MNDIDKTLASIPRNRHEKNMAFLAALVALGQSPDIEDIQRLSGACTTMTDVLHAVGRMRVYCLDNKSEGDVRKIVDAGVQSIGRPPHDH